MQGKLEATSNTRTTVTSILFCNKRNFNNSFLIDTIPPTISPLSIENSTYYSSELPLSFNVDDKNPQLQYCIDNQSNITLTSNTSLNGLTEGTHRITIYAMDISTMNCSQRITFSIIQQSPIILAGFCINFSVG